jgi:hypothetical protein
MRKLFKYYFVVFHKHANVFLRLTKHKKRGRRRFCVRKRNLKQTAYKRDINVRNMYCPTRLPLVLLVKVGCKRSKTMASDDMVLGGQGFECEAKHIALIVFGQNSILTRH